MYDATRDSSAMVRLPSPVPDAIRTPTAPTPCASLSAHPLHAGLLPTNASDWLEFYEQADPVEYSAGGMSL